MTEQPATRKGRWLCLLLAATTLAVFWPVTGHDFINFDDPDYVTSNPVVQQGLTWVGFRWAFTSAHASNWHPLTWLSHMLDVQLFGLKPGWHHLTSLVFHTVNALLLFGVLRRMTGALWRSGLVAAFFALHPLHVESVAWVAERKDVLSTFFMMLTVRAYARYVETRTQNSRLKIPSYLLALFCFAFGLMSKPMLVTVPFVLLLLDYWPLRRLQVAASSSLLSAIFRLAFEKAPFFALAVGSSVLTFWAQNFGGAVASLEHLSIGDRIANALVSFVRYLGKTIWPTDLAVFYPQPSEWPVETIAVCGLLLLVISGLAIRTIRTRPCLFVGWLWYLSTLVPVIGLVQVGMQSMADRYSYVPLIGFFVFMFWGGWDLVSRWPWLGGVMRGAALVALAACLVVTRYQLPHWNTSQTLFEHCVRVTSDNFLAHNNLGHALATQGKLEEARSQYLEALRIRPLFAEAHRNLGVLLTQQGKPEEAMPYLLETVRIRPQYADVYGKLGLALAAEGRFDEAITSYREAIRLKPDLVEALNNLAWILATHPDENLRNATDAVAFATRACDLTRRQVPIMVGTLAAAYAEAGRFGDAIAMAQEARALALAKGQKALAQRNLKLLELYRSGHPCREPPITTEAAKPQP